MKTQLVMLGLLALVLGGVARAEESSGGPTLDHVPVSQVKTGQDLVLVATIHSDNGVFQPMVFFRHTGEKIWSKSPLAHVEGASYTATIPAAALTSGFEYYLETYDNDGNGPVRAGTPEAPIAVTVTTPDDAASKTREVSAVPVGGAGPVKEAVTAEPTTVKQSWFITQARFLGGLACVAGGAVALSVGITGWADRGTATAYANAASANVQSLYQPEINHYLVEGIIGTALGVAGVGVGAWLLVTNAAHESSATQQTVTPVSLNLVPGGAMAAYAGHF